MPPPDIGGVGDDDAIQSVFIYELFVIYMFSDEGDENIVAHIKDIIVSMISVMGIIDAVADAIDAIANTIELLTLLMPLLMLLSC